MNKEYFEREDVQLAHMTLINTKRILGEYSNKLSSEHNRAILALSKIYADFLTTVKTGRFAVPLPTGTGKTTSIIGLIQALEELKFDRGVLICAEKVEALCELNRDLIRYGVPEGKVGLLHSYDHGSEFNRENPKSNTASEPAIPDSEINNRPYLLVTHQRIKNLTGGNQIIFPYRDRPRDLTIWDESLIASDGWSLEIIELEREIGQWKGSYASLNRMGKKLSPEAKILDDFLMGVKGNIESIFENLLPGDNRIFKIESPELEEYQQNAAIKEVLRDQSRAETLKRLIAHAGDKFRVIRTSQNDAFLRYEIVIPEELNKVVILDASYPIRELCKLDKSVKLVDIEFKKDYGSVEINFFESRSSRSFVEEEFSKVLDNALSSEVSGIVSHLQQSQPDEGILLFTFKARKLNVVEKLKSAFELNGVDLSRTDAEGRKLVNFLTWGMETSLNSYAHCKHVILVGVLHLPLTEIAAKAIGQMRNLEAVFERGEIEQLHLHEQAYMIHQALSRGSCRHTVEGKAQPMSVYLFHRHMPAMQQVLGKVMPGVKWKHYEPKYLSSGVSKTNQVAREMVKLLEESGEIRLSSKWVKSELDKRCDEKVNSSIFRKAGDRIHYIGSGWERHNRSFIKVFGNTETTVHRVMQ